LAFLLQQPKYFYAGRIGHCFERGHELFIGHRHDSYQYTHRSILVNMKSSIDRDCQPLFS
jgi:hypothetical protein